MKKKYLLLFIGLIGNVLLTIMINRSNILFLSIILLFFLGICIYNAFIKRLYLFFLFEILTTELYLVMLTRSVLLKMEENSWRINYNLDKINIVSLKYIAISLAIIAVIHIGGFLFSKRDEMQKTAFFPFPKVKIKKNALLICLNFVALLFLGLFIERANIFTVRNYANTIDSTYMPLYLMLLTIYLCMFTDLLKPNFKHNILTIFTKVILLAYMAIFIVIVANGYRYILVQIGTLLFVLYLQKKQGPISKQVIIFTASLGIFFYFLLLYVKKEYLGLSDYSSLMFSHERNIFFSLNALVNGNAGGSTITYFSTLNNLLPKVITNSEHLNVSATIMQFINPKVYEETGITYGAFYLSEAYLSFGFLGIVLVSIILAIIILIIEKNKIKRGGLFIYFYIFVSSQMFNIIYYGSLNYVKAILYFTIILILLRISKVIVFDSPILKVKK